MRYFLLLLLLPILLLAGCTSQEPTTNASAIELGNAVAESQTQDFIEGMRPLSTDEALDTADELEDYLLAAYGLEQADWTDAVVAYSEGFQANELAVIQLSEQADIQTAEQGLSAYVERRKAEFTGYAPEEVSKLEDSLLLRQGRWLLLAICPDPAAAQAAFEAYFQGGAQTVSQAVQVETSAAPVELPRYDTGPVTEAYRTGDTSVLSEQDAAILEACKQVLDQCITDDMTPAEQELAIHDWMVDHTAYDETHELPNRNSPYGLLVEGKVVCMGYANTFQLFMDLLDIPCVTVTGDGHAWNLVQLDGEWYGVDVTWDDPLGSFVDVPAVDEPEHHRYFNVTSDFLRQTDHEWDDPSVPEAEGSRWTWSALHSTSRH